MVWKKREPSEHGRSSLSLDNLRRRRTKGLEVRVEQAEARRGDEVRAVVVVTDTGNIGELDAGLVCREFYDEIVSTNDGASRTTLNAIEHEEWQRLECAPGEYAVSFTVPPHGPYSHQGSCLSFRWEIVARGRKRLALDAQSVEEIAVLP